MLPALERTDTTIDVVHISDPEVTADVTIQALCIEGERPVFPRASVEMRALVERSRREGKAVTVEDVPLNADTSSAHPFHGWLLRDECASVGRGATVLSIAPLNGPAEARANRLTEASDIAYAYIRAGVREVRNVGGLDKYEAIERLRYPDPALGLWLLIMRLTRGQLDEAPPATLAEIEGYDEEAPKGASKRRAGGS